MTMAWSSSIVIANIAVKTKKYLKRRLCIDFIAKFVTTSFVTSNRVATDRVNKSNNNIYEN